MNKAIRKVRVRVRDRVRVRVRLRFRDRVRVRVRVTVRVTATAGAWSGRRVEEDDACTGSLRRLRRRHGLPRPG